MTFLLEDAELNNTYFQAAWQVPEDALPGDVVEYCLRIAYDDHVTTYLMAAGT